MDGFRYTTEVQVRYEDLDPMNHVNNSVYSTFFEEARAAYFDDVLGTPIDAEDVVLASLGADFEATVTRADSPVTVGVRVPEVGRSSVPFEYEVRSSGERKATGATTLVCYDRETERARPVPEDWRTAIAAHEGLTDA